MATKRLPDVHPVQPVASLNAHRDPSLKHSRKNTAGVTDDRTIPQPAAESDQRIQQREPTRQTLFQKKCNDTLELPNGYLKVAVLIIRWDESIDDFKGHTEEIARLQRIFENSYGYTCKVHPINIHKKPQVDLNRAVLNHIYDHDDPNNLLIFYYTGHGDQRENALEISANQNFMDLTGGHLPTALWASAEEPILKDMVGDALSILDCCMASTAGRKSRSGLPRTYQLLAASAADAPTCGPGQNSFTTALCESLEELASGPEDGTFFLAQLCQRINTKRKSQACIPWDQMGLFKRTIQFCRLEQSTNMQSSFCNEDPEQSALYLRFSFRSKDLEDEQIERLAEQLPPACHEANVPLRRIDWVRMTNAEEGLVPTPSMFRTVAIEADEACVMGVQTDTLFEDNNNEIFGNQRIDFYRAVRTLNAAQKLLAPVRKKQSKQRQNMYMFIILKLFGLSLMFALLYFRGEQEELVFSGFLLAMMVTYGPCRLVGFGGCPVEGPRGVDKPFRNGNALLGRRSTT